MQIISPNYILTPDLLLENQSIAFEKNIVKIATQNNSNNNASFQKDSINL